MGKNGKTLTCALWVAAILWMGLCLYLSWQPGSETANLSGALTKVVRRGLQLFGFDIDLDALHVLLRRNAHTGVFLVAGLLTFFALARSLPESAHADALAFGIAAAMCALLAVVAEVGKLWVPGRHLQWDETLLDVIGVICGAGIAWAVKFLWAGFHR